MVSSKKRNKGGRNTAAFGQRVPAALKDWVHVWHGVRVHQEKENGRSIFHAGSKGENMSIWKQFIRLPANSLFPSVETINNPRAKYKDYLYIMLNMRWPMLCLVLLLIFLAIVFIFAVLSCYACQDPDNFLESFDLSYQTFTTIGFGVTYPKGSCGNSMMVIESFFAMLVTSAITGLVFAKFARPQAKIAFSEVCVIQPYGTEHLALVIRVANATKSHDAHRDVIMETVFKLNVLRIEEANASSDGVYNSWNEMDGHVDSGKRLCSYNLKVLQNNFITFRMGLAVVHVIDEDSPFYGMSEKDLRQSDMILEVALSGVDSTLQDTVAERYIYTAGDFRWGYRFAELLTFDEKNAAVSLDFSKISAVEAAPINETVYVEPAKRAKETESTTSDEEEHEVVVPKHPPMTEAGNLRRRAGPLKAIGEMDASGEQDYLLVNRPASNSRSRNSAEEAPPARSVEPLFEPLIQSSRPKQDTEEQNGQPTRRLQRSFSRTNQEDKQEVSIPHTHRRRLQRQMTGIIDEGDCDQPGDGNTVNDTEENGVIGNEFEHDDGDILRNSVVSVDVDDTPRFLKIIPKHLPRSSSFMKLYYRALHEPWKKIVIAFVVVFLGVNVLFALIYWAKMSDIEAYADLTVSNFELALYLSAHSVSTVGYGSVSPMPQSVYMNVWVFIESAIGIIIVTIITGIAWSKFARPRAHIHFSKNIIVSRIYGHRCLVFRAANTRHSGEVFENFFRIGMILTNKHTGLKQMHDVSLVQADWPSLKLPATLIHIIDEKSPFYRFQSLERLSEARVAVIVLLTGLDTTFAENVYARHWYFYNDFAYDQGFADFATIERGHIRVNYNDFGKLLAQVPTSSAHPTGHLAQEDA